MKRKTILSLIAVVLIFSMAACSNNKEKEESVVIAGSTSVQPLSEVIAEDFMTGHQNITVDVQGGGSGQGIKSIDEKIADIGSLSRDVKKEEKQSVSKEYVIAKDGIAVVLNKDITVDNLSIDQIRDIYTGKIKNWKEVGGADKAITVVSREAGSGTRGAFTEITGVLIKDKAENEIDQTVTAALVQPSTGAVLKTVASTPDSIGYISLGAVNETVKAVKVDNVEATIENVLSDKYKIQRPFVYVVGENVSEAAKSYIDYALSKEGQKLVEENGFIPIQ